MLSYKQVQKSARTIYSAVESYVAHPVASLLADPAHKATDHFRRGRALFSERLFAESVAEVRKALDLNALPIDLECEAHLTVASALMQLKQEKDALKAANFAVRCIRPGVSAGLQTEVFFTRALLRRDLMRLFEESLLDFKSALETASLARKSEIWVEVGKTRVMIGDLKGAVVAYEEVLRESYARRDVKLELAGLFLQLDQFKALDDITESLLSSDSLKDPLETSDRAKVYAIRGTAEFRQKNFEKSLEYLSEALVLDPSMGEARRLRGIAHFKINQFRKGFKDLIIDLKLGPTSPEDLDTLQDDVDEKCQILERLRIPEEFICPITQTPMKDPVVVSDGHSYERSAIEEWFSKNDTSPLTREVLVDKSLRPNIALRNSINDFRVLCPSIFEDDVGFQQLSIRDLD